MRGRWENNHPHLIRDDRIHTTGKKKTTTVPDDTCLEHVILARRGCGPAETTKHTHDIILIIIIGSLLERSSDF